jgi:hypothetical protein
MFMGRNVWTGGVHDRERGATDTAAPPVADRGHAWWFSTLAFTLGASAGRTTPCNA